MTEVKTSGSRRIPKGKRQLLSILDEDVVEQTKIAAVRSNSRVSHVVQEALKQWLARQRPTASEMDAETPTSRAGREG